MERPLNRDFRPAGDQRKRCISPARGHLAGKCRVFATRPLNRAPRPASYRAPGAPSPQKSTSVKHLYIKLTMFGTPFKPGLSPSGGSAKTPYFPCVRPPYRQMPRFRDPAASAQARKPGKRRFSSCAANAQAKTLFCAGRSISRKKSLRRLCRLSLLVGNKAPRRAASLFRFNLTRLTPKPQVYAT